MVGMCIETLGIHAFSSLGNADEGSCQGRAVGLSASNLGSPLLVFSSRTYRHIQRSLELVRVGSKGNLFIVTSESCPLSLLFKGQH